MAQTEIATRATADGQRILHSEDGQAVIADMANFVTGGATLLISHE